MALTPESEASISTMKGSLGQCVGMHSQSSAVRSVCGVLSGDVGLSDDDSEE